MGDKEEKKEDKKDPFPDKIATPVEHEASISKADEQYWIQLRDKYKSEQVVKEHPDFLLRFVLGYADEKESKRYNVTVEHIEYYLTRYKSFDFGNVSKLTLSETEKKILEAWPVYIYGNDKQGHPIMYEPMGSIDIEAIQKYYASNPDSIRRVRYRFMAKLNNLKSYLSKKYGKLIYKHVVIVDLKGFNKKFLGNQMRKLSKDITKDLAMLYPEMTYKTFVINVPAAFSKAWKVVKTFVHPNTRAKMKMYGTKDYTKFIQEINEYVDITMIPPQFGGMAKYTITLGDIPSDYGNIDACQVYPYTLPKFEVVAQQKKKRRFSLKRNKKRTESDLDKINFDESVSAISISNGVSTSNNVDLN